MSITSRFERRLTVLFASFGAMLTQSLAAVSLPMSLLLFRLSLRRACWSPSLGRDILGSLYAWLDLYGLDIGVSPHRSITLGSAVSTNNNRSRG